VKLNNPAEVARQYAGEQNLEARRSIYDTQEGPDPRQVAFDAIAEAAPQRVLEVGGGPGELAARLQDELGCEVVMVDVAPRMVELATERGVDAQVGDAQALPFPDKSFDVAVAAWMLYHVPDLDQALSELARVLRPGGRLAVLELTRPTGVLRPFFRLWFDVLIPLAGKVLPGGVAYSYLPASVRRFPGPDDLAGALRRAGFADVGYRLLAGGIVSLHVGRR
jgi:demethylmenaquinone methyltransferase / 2-methoxy-6-polyprenyl-1,4-benzoquinol methylase